MSELENLWEQYLNPKTAYSHKPHLLRSIKTIHVKNDMKLVAIRGIVETSLYGSYGKLRAIKLELDK